METIDITVSPSELDTMRQCPLKHQLVYHERWTKAPTEAHPLGFGTLWHKVMERHYLTLKSAQDEAHKAEGSEWWQFDHDDTLRRARILVNDILSEVEDEDVKFRLQWMYDGHVEAFGVDPTWQILAVEFACEVALPGPPGFATPFRFRIKMKIDLVIKVAGRIWIVDHKSCKNLPRKTEMDLDDQFGLYHWGMLNLEYNVFGMYHSAARKEPLKTKALALDDRFLRTPLTRGRVELDKIALEAWQTANERYRTMYEAVETRRATGINIEAPRHPQPTTCGWKCDFTEACIAGRKGIDLRDYVYRKGYRQDRSRH